MGTSVSVGSRPRRFSLSVRVSGLQLEPAKVTEALECQPDVALRRGDPLSKRGSAKAPGGVWLIQVENVAAEDLSATLVKLLRRTTDKTEVWGTLAREFQVDLFVGIFAKDDNTIWELETEAIRELAQRHLAISFDYYSGAGSNV